MTVVPSLPNSRRLLRWFSNVLLAVALAGLHTAPMRAQSSSSRPSSANAGESSAPINAVPEKRQEATDESEELRRSPAVEKFGSLLGLNAEQAARKLIITAETDRMLVEGFARQLTGDRGGQN